MKTIKIYNNINLEHVNLNQDYLLIKENKHTYTIKDKFRNRLVSKWRTDPKFATALVPRSLSNGDSVIITNRKNLFYGSKGVVVGTCYRNKKTVLFEDGSLANLPTSSLLLTTDVVTV